jgi:hypothetical protein
MLTSTRRFHQPRVVRVLLEVDRAGHADRHDEGRGQDHQVERPDERRTGCPTVSGRRPRGERRQEVPAQVGHPVAQRRDDERGEEDDRHEQAEQQRGADREVARAVAAGGALDDAAGDGGFGDGHGYS